MKRVPDCECPNCGAELFWCGTCDGHATSLNAEGVCPDCVAEDEQEQEGDPK